MIVLLIQNNYFGMNHCPSVQDHFSQLISKKSKIQVVNIKDQKELNNYFKKNLLEDEMVICMGAGSISNWIREISNESK